MKLDVLAVVIIFISICLLIPDKSAVLITVSYPLSTPTAIVVGELERAFAAASTTDGVFIDAQSAVETASFHNGFTEPAGQTAFVTSSVGTLTSTVNSGGGSGSGSETVTTTVTSTVSGSGSGGGSGSDESDELGDDDVIIPIITQTKNVVIPGEEVLTNLYVTETVLQIFTQTKPPQKTEFVYTATVSVLKHLRLPNHRPQHGYHPDYDYYRRHY